MRNANYMHVDLDSGRYFDEYLDDLCALGKSNPYGSSYLTNSCVRQLAREVLSLRALTNTRYPRPV